MVSDFSHRDIILDAPKSMLSTAILMGMFLLLVGFVLPFVAASMLPLASAWLWVCLLISLLFIAVGIWSGPVEVWNLLHHPILEINAEGICRPSMPQKPRIQWEEIESIYCSVQMDTMVFVVKASPMGLMAMSSRKGWKIPRGRPKEARTLTS